MTPMTDPSAEAAPFRAAWLAAGGGLYLAGETWLRVISYNSAAGVVVTVAGRMLHLDGSTSTFRFDHVPATDRSLATAAHQLGEGWLLNVQAYASAGAPLRGQCYVGVELSRGGVSAREPVATLVKDYVAEGQGIAWPGSPVRASIEGPGALRTIVGTNPAAGAEVLETVPTGARWRLLAVRLVLTTDATVANRATALTLDDGANQFARFAPSSVNTASTAVSHTFTSVGASFTSQGFTSPLLDPAAALLLAGYRIGTQTSNIQAADDYAAPILLVEEWIEP